jgi:Concanavalin A-like lectin/glucanases superfamily
MSKRLLLAGVVLPLLLALLPSTAWSKGKHEDHHKSRHGDSRDDDSADNGSGQVPGQCVQPASSLLSWWPAEGTAEDVWGDNDGTLVDATFTSGKVGQAFDFSGSLDHVRVPHSPSLDFTANDPYTIEFWIKTDGVSEGHPALVEKWASPTIPAYPFAVRLNTGDPRFSSVGPKGTIFCGVFDGSEFPFVWSSTAIDDDQYHHVACVYDNVAKSIEVYIDGFLDGTQNYSGLADINNDQDIFFGIRGNLNPLAEFNRYLDEVSIYTSALSADEIRAIYEAGSAGKCRAFTVDIDVKPGSDTNAINLNDHGVIPVAINGSADFSVLDVDFGSLNFEGLEVGVRCQQGPQCGLEDWNQDGFLDAVCHFEDNVDNWAGGETVATLSGQLFDGTPFTGTDSIQLVPDHQKAKKVKKAKREKKEKEQKKDKSNKGKSKKNKR